MLGIILAIVVKLLIGLAIGLGVFILLIDPLADWLAHLEMTAEAHNSHKTLSIKKISFKEFKKLFDSRLWGLETTFKYSFFSLDNYNYFKNYIHANIVIINNISYKFGFFSFVRFDLWRKRTWAKYETPLYTVGLDGIITIADYKEVV